MDPVTVFRRCIDQTGTIIANVRPDELDDPTPCSGWNVRALVNHTIAVAEAFGSAARGLEFDPSPFEKDHAGDNPGAAYNVMAIGLHEALSHPDVLQHDWHMPFGPVPGEQGIAFSTLELAQHGWDIARATGQEPDFDPEVTEVALAVAQAAPPDLVRREGVFGPEAPCPDGVSRHDQLAAFLGRTV